MKIYARRVYIIHYGAAVKRCRFITSEHRNLGTSFIKKIIISTVRAEKRIEKTHVFRYNIIQENPKDFLHSYAKHRGQRPGTMTDKERTR